MHHVKWQHSELFKQFYGNEIAQIKVTAHCNAFGFVCGIVCSGSNAQNDVYTN